MNVIKPYLDFRSVHITFSLYTATKYISLILCSRYFVNMHVSYTVHVISMMLKKKKRSNASPHYDFFAPADGYEFSVYQCDECVIFQPITHALLPCAHQKRGNKLLFAHSHYSRLCNRIFLDISRNLFLFIPEKTKMVVIFFNFSWVKI